MPVDPVTLKEVIDRMLTGKFAGNADFLDWPPDAFAVAATLLQVSGAYSEVVNLSQHWPPGGRSLSAWHLMIKEIAARWSSSFPDGSVPPEVQDWWKMVLANSQLPIGEVRLDPDVWQALVQIIAAADEACEGVGLPFNFGEESRMNALFFEAHRRLWRTSKYTSGGAPGQSASLCRLDPSRAIVLPKLHTPQKGITLRSLSHNLALCPTGDISATWMNRGFSQDARATSSHSVNLLLVPFPAVIKPSQFVAIEDASRRVPEAGQTFGYFEFHPESFPPTILAEWVCQLCREADEMLGTVDGVIFPELALNPAQYEAIRKKLPEGLTMMVGGIAVPGTSEKPSANNAWTSVKLEGEWVEVVEHSKHHRWKLDDSQICQYGLGARLNPSVSWWEHIPIGRRQLNFFALEPWFTFTVLICEDLARPDPAGHLIRAVGPNLVIALLMDGPQLTQRWSSRSAAVLAEDPGCSVLTLTSAGMAKLSRPNPTQAPSNIVALWKDSITGTVEIPLPEGASGIILSLVKEKTEEWSADGRGDGKNSSVLKLAGIHEVRTPLAVHRDTGLTPAM